MRLRHIEVFNAVMLPAWWAMEQLLRIALPYAVGSGWMIFQ